MNTTERNGKATKVVANGVEYKSITQCALDLLVDPSTLAKHLRSGSKHLSKIGLDKISFEVRTCL